MDFSHANSGPAVFFRLAGSLTVTANINGLRAAIGAVSDQAVRGVFLDLGRITRLDCSGIGELLQLRSLVVTSGRSFGLVNVGGRERRLLELARLAAVLGIHDSPADALRSIAAAAPRSTADASEPFVVHREQGGARLGPSYESAPVS
jgi:anti-anti-sigma factor